MSSEPTAFNFDTPITERKDVKNLYTFIDKNDNDNDNNGLDNPRRVPYETSIRSAHKKSISNYLM